MSSGKRGGLLSSYRRKTAMEGGDELTIDASCVLKRLWQGSMPPVEQALPAFSIIVLAADSYQPESVAWRGRVVRAPMEDAEPSQNDIVRALAAAREVATEIRRGGRALITCHAGLNRSGLICAMTILMLRPKATPDAAIKVIRARRDPQALSNPHFVTAIRNLWSSRTPTARR